MAIVQTSSGVPSHAPQAVFSNEPCISDADLLRRFSEHRDENAFELLVQRHGPMVLGVCRRALQDAHAAEDAFQATFLVLVRKASSIQNPDLLGSWLYGVAFRTASRARAQAVKRHNRELRTAMTPQNAENNEIQRNELRAILDEEINRLPEKFREAFVLCHLQEKTHAEAARLLECPAGSISSRLEKAREKLQSRLSRRGVSLTAGVFAVVLLESTARSEVSTNLIDATVRNAMLTATGDGVAGIVPSKVVKLASDVSRRISLRTRRSFVILFLLALAIGPLAYQAAIFAEPKVTTSEQNVAKTVTLEAPEGVSVFALPAGDSDDPSSVTSANSSSCCR